MAQDNDMRDTEGAHSVFHRSAGAMVVAIWSIGGYQIGDVAMNEKLALFRAKD